MGNGYSAQAHNRGDCSSTTSYDSMCDACKSLIVRIVASKTQTLQQSFICNMQLLVPNASAHYVQKDAS